MAELYHYGVKGMKWGVRKAANRSEKDSRRMLKKLNRANNRMEKHRTVQTVLNDRIDAGKRTKNPLIKLYGMSFVLDQKFAAARYADAKKKVDDILDDFNKRGVTLNQLEERKTGLSVGISYDYISRWNGHRYELK
jgi:hypothetical protein